MVARFAGAFGAAFRAWALFGGAAFLRAAAFRRGAAVLDRRGDGRDTRTRAALRLTVFRTVLEALRLAFPVVLRAALRVRAFPWRFAITGVLSAPYSPSRRAEASLTVYP